MTLADVAGAGAGPCAPGHLPAPQPRSLRASARASNARPQLAPSPLHGPRHVPLFPEGAVGKWERLFFPPPPPILLHVWNGGWQVGGAGDRWLTVDGDTARRTATSSHRTAWSPCEPSSLSLERHVQSRASPQARGPVLHHPRLSPRLTGSLIAVYYSVSCQPWACREKRPETEP